MEQSAQQIFVGLSLFTITQVFTIPGTSSTLQLVMIDTVVLAGLTDPLLRGLPPTGPTSLTRAEDQWQWIEETLASSNADWIIVAGHYPGMADTLPKTHFPLPHVQCGQ